MLPKLALASHTNPSALASSAAGTAGANHNAQLILKNNFLLVITLCT